ncbi:MAG: ABC transporter substrate-binding protein [Actinomycetota bacterium]|nr:ABC transporter substrate-binding protein [Actinomycetota bacterium]
MSRLRAYRRWGTIFVLATLVLVGCGGGGSEEEEPVEDAARAPVQNLRVAAGEDPFLRGNPPALNVGLTAAGPNLGIFETLTRLSPNFGLAAGLAQRWESPSPNQWRFFLRPNVTFHNGARMDAGAVVSTLETIARRQNNKPRGLEPGTAKARDDMTVEIDLASPNARLAEQLASPTMGIVAPGTEAGAGETPATTPTGTGPFRFDSYRPGGELKVAAFEQYWGEKPQLASILFRFGPERDAGRLLATRAVELVGLIPYEFLPKVSGRTDRVVGSQPARAQYLLLNVGGIEEWATLKDENVRRAIALALDRRAVAKAGWPDDGEENNTLIPALVLGDADERVRPPAQNVAESNRLLDTAGWVRGGDGQRTKDGTSLSLSLILARPAEQERAAEELKKQLGAVGVGLQVVDPAPEGAFSRVNTATFDLYLASQPQDDANPCAICRFFTVRPGGNLAFASAAGGGQKVDDLYERVFSSPSPDTARRLAADIMNVVITERFTAVPLAAVRTEWLVSPRVRGFEPAALGGDQRWESVWLTV